MTYVLVMMLCLAQGFSPCQTRAVGVMRDLDACRRVGKMMLDRGLGTQFFCQPAHTEHAI